MANHLIIGLGGTGGKVLRELRKRVYEEFRSNDPGNGVFLDYVYVDSSPADLEDRTGWNVLGKSVHLGMAQKVNIHGISMGVLNNINMYPGLKGFLNPNDLQLMRQEMGALITAGIGGQRRRLGRTLMANNIFDVNNSVNFEHVVRGAVQRLQQASKTDDVTFHICAGLAGGTGSGSIIDAIAQIRTWFPYQQDTHAFKIRLFIYTPERTLVSTRHDAGFYQANGYAALLELNALSIGQYHPTDVKGEKDIFTGEIRRLLENQEAFEVAYVYTNVNEQGKVLDLSQGLPAAVADFIFQTTVASGIEGDTGQLHRLVGCENDGAAPERNQGGEIAHSRKFLSFGITRVEFPETEIREYMTYNYALQATRQLTYNMWQEGIGYGERSMEEVGIGFADSIKDKKNREGLMLSNNYLTLAKPIVETPSTGKWRLFEETWEARTQAEADDVMATVDKKQWLTNFSARCEEFFNHRFRQHGVAEFFKIQQQERKGYARVIRRHIEKKLFDEWVSGAKNSKSILEIEKYTRLLIENCSSRTTEFDVQKARLEEEQSLLSQQINEINQEWGNIGFLRGLLNRHQEVFAQYKTAKSEYYAAATRVIAYGYAKELLQDIMEELGRMLDGILAFKDELSAINEEVLRQASTKCQINETLSDTNIKKYSPETVHAICRQFVSSESDMMQNAAAIRSRMAANLGEEGEHTFANLYDKTDYESAINIILDICQKNALRDMENAAKNDPLTRMVGVNVLEKLRTELNTDEKMEQFVKLVLQTSNTYVQFDAAQRAMDISGNVGESMRMVQLALPASDERTNDFRQRLIDAFVKEVPGFDPTQDVALNYKENQIVVISANSGFPLRFLANVKTAKEKYDALVSRQNEKWQLNKMVLHTESFQEKLKNLYEDDPGTIMNEVIHDLILAYALGIISEQQDPVTQARFEAFPVLRQAVGQVLQNQILPSSLCENNQFNPNYTRFRNLAQEIITEQLQDL